MPKAALIRKDFLFFFFFFLPTHTSESLEAWRSYQLRSVEISVVGDLQQLEYSKEKGWHDEQVNKLIRVVWP